MVRLESVKDSVPTISNASSASTVPGWSGFNFEGDYLCTDPPAGALVIAGRDDAPVSVFPLGNCEGVCASDDDCEGSLECFSRASTESVRGCEGVGSPGVNYCYSPVALLKLWRQWLSFFRVSAWSL
jgi:hypothetical protein